ncbi:unnamed protein product [Ectocarpus sp. CCAP 1310/34]|nr:unnamed protein product [Ectocarpus sp. CCAP 1310/34]
MRVLGVVLFGSATQAFLTVPPHTSPPSTACASNPQLHVPFARHLQLLWPRASSTVVRMLGGEEGSEEEKGYTDVTVREAVEWTMSKDSEFSYIDIRSAEEHEKLATVRGALCIPAFELVMPEAEEKGEGLDDQDSDDTGYAPDYNFEELDYTVKPDFVDTMKARFDLDAKLLIGCKTYRSAKACELLVAAGFTEIYNVESQIFMRTRAPEVWS